MLKIVDCANAVCAVTATKRATNNPERTLKFFTVVSPPFFLMQKKTPSSTDLVCNWTPLSSEFFAAQHCAAREIFNRPCRRLSIKNFGGHRKTVPQDSE